MGFPGTGFRGSYDLLTWCWEPFSGPLGEQKALLSTEPSSQTCLHLQDEHWCPSACLTLTSPILRLRQGRAGCPGALYIDQAGLERPKRSSCLCLQVVGLKVYTTTPGAASNSFGFITRNGIAGSYTVRVGHFEEPQMVFHPGRTFENHQQ